MHAAKGILTARGGMTSHAAVVARGMGRPCVSGAGSLSISAKDKVMRIGGREVREGDRLTLDGATGEVMAGEVPTVQPELSGDFGTLMGWADELRRMKVRTNADTPADAKTARDFGAEGIGLCRTEHMFFEAARITAVRQMILSQDEQGRRAALDRLLPEQRGDFVGIFEAMAGLPVTIRLLDPPLHEFLPHADAEFDEVARVSGIDAEQLKRRAAELHEFNPMLGHRGVRLGVTYPEIYEMQARAIFEAACDVATRGDAPVPEVMIPLVATRRELELMKAVDDKTAREVFAEKGREVDYLARRQPRRRRAVSRRLCRAGRLSQGPVRQPRHRGRRRAGADGRRPRPRHPPRPQARHLRRARRRPGEHRLLRAGRPRLRQRQPLSRPHRPPRGRAGGAEGEVRAARWAGCAIC